MGTRSPGQPPPHPRIISAQSEGQGRAPPADGATGLVALLPDTPPVAPQGPCYRGMPGPPPGVSGGRQHQNRSRAKGRREFVLPFHWVPCTCPRPPVLRALRNNPPNLPLTPMPPWPASLRYPLCLLPCGNLPFQDPFPQESPPLESLNPGNLSWDSERPLRAVPGAQSGGTSPGTGGVPLCTKQAAGRRPVGTGRSWEFPRSHEVIRGKTKLHVCLRNRSRRNIRKRENALWTASDGMITLRTGHKDCGQGSVVGTAGAPGRL